MGDLVSLDEFKKQAPQKRKSSESKDVKKRISKSEMEKIFVVNTAELMVQWNMYSKQDQLNALIANKLKISQKDFIHDLNLLSTLEQGLNFSRVVFSPNTMVSCPNGWMIGFHFEDVPYTTPEMSDECHVRAFAIVVRSMFQEAINNKM